MKIYLFQLLSYIFILSILEFIKLMMTLHVAQQITIFKESII